MDALKLKYFVLNPTSSDEVHATASRTALVAYAAVLETNGLTGMANDIRKTWGLAHPVADVFVAGDNSPADREARDLRIGPYAWRPHNGGARPPFKRAEIRFRYGDTCMTTDKSECYWHHDGMGGDIVAYRIIEA